MMYDFQLPSGIECSLREMTGVEEELLTNQRLIRTGDAINQVLRNCIIKLGDVSNPDINDILNLLSGDRLFALVKLRQVSLGDEVTLQLCCPSAICRKNNMVTVNLEDLEVTPYTTAREFLCPLPGSKQVVKFCYLDGHKEKRLASFNEPNITQVMLIRIVDIDGKAVTKKDLTSMSMRDRSFLRQRMLEVDAGINSAVEVDCEACGTKISTRLEAESAFLFPAVRL